MEVQRIVADLQVLIEQTRKGSEALHDAELDLAKRELDLDTAEQKAFLLAEGSVAERTAKARLECAQLRFERDVSKAQVNRVRTKIKGLESELMAQATISKLIQAEMRL